MTACCPLDGGDQPPMFQQHLHGRRAQASQVQRVPRDDPAGAKYERFSGKWDREVSTFKTCLSCVEIRNHFACASGWTFGEVWSQLEEFFFPDMKAGGPCMDGLSPEAKARLFEKRLAWLVESEIEVDGAPPPSKGPS